MEYYLNLIISLFVFIIGTLFGSFFTLAIYRIPRRQDIVKTRSYCPNCKHRLGFFDCFPILSYISTIGRCRYCKKPISIRYPLIEFVSGMFFLLSYLLFGFSITFFLLIAAYVYSFLVFGSDIMKSKMTEEEIKEVEKMKENKKKKVGAVNIDIAIAVIVFVVFFVSTIYVNRNYANILIEYERKSEALNICLNNINEAKASNVFEWEGSSNLSGKTEIDGATYTYDVQVLPYVKDGETEVDNARVIVSTVTYVINGNENSISLKSIKVDNI